MPNQDIGFYNNTSFIFKINEKLCLNITLTPGTTILFTGKYLTHRQHCKLSNGYNGELNFVNIAGYGNNRLFSHSRSSLIKSQN